MNSRNARTRPAPRPHRSQPPPLTYASARLRRRSLLVRVYRLQLPPAPPPLRRPRRPPPPPRRQRLLPFLRQFLRQFLLFPTAARPRRPTLTACRPPCSLPNPKPRLTRLPTPARRFLTDLRLRHPEPVGRRRPSRSPAGPRLSRQFRGDPPRSSLSPARLCQSRPFRTGPPRSSQSRAALYPSPPSRIEPPQPSRF